MSFIVPASARSWVLVDPNSHFSLQNLPFGQAEIGEDIVPVSRIGDYVINLVALMEADLISSPEDMLFLSLDTLLEIGGTEVISQIREELFNLFVETCSDLRDNAELRAEVLIPADQVTMEMPLTVAAFVDFYSGINHASNVGRMFRPDMPPLLPNYRHLPVGYNGRASSLILDGDPVIRPRGQTKGSDDEKPSFGPTKELDFELEIGFYVGEGNAMGEPIEMGEARNHIMGLCLVNDWSARDVQRWEYQPLGPFLAKSFATSVSPWIVTLDALEPFRVDGQVQDPEVLDHLKESGKAHFDLQLEVSLKTPKMTKPQVITTANSKDLYWSIAQQLVHQTSNGTPVEPGDLYASGTISGTEPGTFGSLLELTWRGANPITMTETGETRTFLEDGDELIMTGFAQGNGFRVGFGEIRSIVLATL